MRKYYDLLLPFYAARWLLRYLRANPQQRELLRFVPEACMECELLDLCRDATNGWKCRRGCLARMNRRCDGGEDGDL